VSREFFIDVSEITKMITDEEIMALALDEIDEVVDDIYVDLVAPPPGGTPVDTGEARQSWQVDKSDPLKPEIYTTSAYMNRLNEGSSKQSPAGFVEAAIDKHSD
jgi:hypothetical protein